MGILIFGLIALVLWLWWHRKEARKGTNQSAEGGLLQAIRNDPSDQEYSEKFSKPFGDSFDKLFGAAKKLHEVYKEEDDVFQKNLERLKTSAEPFPFPFPRQITLLDELDALIADTRRALDALTPSHPRRVMHSEYALMLDCYKEWSQNYRAFIRIFGTARVLDMQSEEALHEHEKNIQRASEATAATLKRALDQQQKVKKLLIELVVDTVAAKVDSDKEEAAEASLSYGLAEQYSFDKKMWPHYHRYAARILSAADDATQYTLKKYHREADEESGGRTYVLAIQLFAYLAQQYGMKAAGNEQFFAKLPDAVFVLLGHREPSWQANGMHKLREGFQGISEGATKWPDLAPRDNWENGIDTVLGRIACGAVQKMGFDLDRKETLEPLMEVVAYWNEKASDLADAHNELLKATQKEASN